MDRFFIAIYRFLEKRRPLMWILLLGSFVLFVFFGARLKYEEDISKLLPSSDKAEESGLAFSNLKVKDKIFIQILGKDGDIDPSVLAAYSDEFVEGLAERDANGYIAGILNGISEDVMMNALDYAMNNVPLLVDTSAYREFDRLLEPDAISLQMKVNRELLDSDEDGNITSMVAQDPAALRKALLPQAEAIMGGGTGYTMVEGHLFCPDSTVALVFLSPEFNSMDSKAGTALVEMIEDEIADFTAGHPDAEVLFHGAPVQSVFNSRYIKRDLILTIGISLILICLVIGFCFKGKGTLPMLLAPVIYGAFFSLACVYWIKGGMSLMAIGLGALVLGVALSYCLHVLTHYKYVGDPVQVLRDQATPVCLGCLTTIGAFAGLLFTQSELLRDFGIFASFAMVGTTLFALVFLPHFFRPENNRKNEKAFALLDRINSYPLDRCRWLLALIAVVCAVCCYTQRWVTFDSDLKHIGYNEPSVVRSGKIYAEKNNRGLVSMYYASTGNTLDEALEGSRGIVSVLDSMESQGIVKQYSKVSNLFITESARKERIDRWNAYWTGTRVRDVRNAISRAAAECGIPSDLFEPFFAMVTADYVPSSLYEAGVLPDELLCNFIEETIDGQFMVFTSVLMPEQDRMAVNDAVASLPHAVVIDPFYYTNDMVRILNDDFNVILGISTIFVFIVLLLSFRSLSLAVLAFLPMGLSWYVVRGVMGIFAMQFNLINIVIATFIFGIGVDYSIFVMNGLLSKASGKDDRLLIYHKTAIFFSAFVLIVVVVSLLFATHPAIHSIGVSTLIGMGSTILLTYSMQPFLFRQMMKVKYFRRRFGKKEE
ncbi:MAG: MMPL family transporter [Bacteroidales bacterium]|nr:MMPL family transporter [Bacteroidales bacterium]